MSDKVARRRKASQEWRSRLKEDELKYKSFRESNSIRLKLYRLNLSEEQKKRNNELAKARMAKYRARKKAQGKLPSRQWKVKAPSPESMEEQRKAWREAKRIQRKKQTAQKKAAINEQRRALYAETKLKSQKGEKQRNTKATSSLALYKCSNDVWRKAASRLLRVLPKDPESFAKVIFDIVSKSSPTKKAALAKRFRTSPASQWLDVYSNTSKTSSLTEKIKQLRHRRKDKDDRMRILLQSALAVKGKFML